jgi:hypothetical protein|mmetsp:Transcript_1196/g.2107  ORF Transcript_1196/g.2107 Transcript_1196/m.2107 type:complete len:212 (+) Transcript_1196:1990-2625(+)
MAPFQCHFGLGPVARAAPSLRCTQPPQCLGEHCPALLDPQMLCRCWRAAVSPGSFEYYRQRPLSELCPCTYLGRSPSSPPQCLCSLCGPDLPHLPRRSSPPPKTTTPHTDPVAHEAVVFSDVRFPAPLSRRYVLSVHFESCMGLCPLQLQSDWIGWTAVAVPSQEGGRQCIVFCWLGFAAQPRPTSLPTPHPVSPVSDLCELSWGDALAPS